jgi:hypothetical protein
MAEAVDKHIPASDRMDYLKIINDIYVTKQRKEDIINTMRQILEEHGYHENGQN